MHWARVGNCGSGGCFAYILHILREYAYFAYYAYIWQVHHILHISAYVAYICICKHITCAFAYFYIYSIFIQFSRMACPSRLNNDI